MSHPSVPIAFLSFIGGASAVATVGAFLLQVGVIRPNTSWVTFTLSTIFGGTTSVVMVTGAAAVASRVSLREPELSTYPPTQQADAPVVPLSAPTTPPVISPTQQPTLQVAPTTQQPAEPVQAQPSFQQSLDSLIGGRSFDD